MLFPAIFALVVGAGMIVQWSISFLRRQIPELESEPVRIRFHLAGEIVTALTLVVSGACLFTDNRWGPMLFLIAIGMLLYTVIVSPGYFAQKRQWGWVVVFGLLLVLSVAAIVLVFRQLLG